MAGLTWTGDLCDYATRVSFGGKKRKNERGEEEYFKFPIVEETCGRPAVTTKATGGKIVRRCAEHAHR